MCLVKVLLYLKKITNFLSLNCRSFGVALWECVQFGTLPYADLTNEHVLRLVIKEKSIKLPKPDLPVSHIDRL